MQLCRVPAGVAELCFSSVRPSLFRQQRAQLYYQRLRKFGTRPGLKQIAHSHPSTEDVSVPLASSETTVPVEHSSTVNGESDVLRDTATADLQTQQGNEPQEHLQEKQDSPDEVNGQLAPESAVRIGPEGQGNSHPGTAALKSRLNPRKARKLRRIEAGTYKPTTAQHDVEASQIDTVLKKLEVLDGSEGVEEPNVQSAQKTRTLRQAKANKDSQKQTRDQEQRAAKPVRKASEDSQKLTRERAQCAAKPARKANEDSQKQTKGKDVAAAKPPRKPKRETWQVQKEALDHKFGEQSWNPRKRLSPDTLDGIRAIHASDTVAYSTEILSQHFKVTPEAIRRILKSKWRPNDEETADRKVRWERRGVKNWDEMAALGMRPPAKWRAMGVGSEGGVKEERVPKRKSRGQMEEAEHLSWDDVVAGATSEGARTSMPGQLL